VMSSYKELRIPTDWMLDSGMASKVIISLALLIVHGLLLFPMLDR